MGTTDFRYTRATQHTLWTQGAESAEEGKTENVKHLRERLQLYGACTLSTVELLSIMLSAAPSTQSIIHQVHTLLASHSLQELLRMDFGELSSKYLLGDAKAAQLQALIELARRLTLPTEEERYEIRSPADAAQLVTEMSFLSHEELRVLCLDTKNRVVANIRLYQGTINSSVLRAAEIIKPAIIRANGLPLFGNPQAI